MIDEKKVRRETLRWYLLRALHNGDFLGAYEEVLLSTMQALYPDATNAEVRKELTYLEARELAMLVRHPDGRWQGKLSRHGVDVVEYTVNVEPGIARPARS